VKPEHLYWDPARLHLTVIDWGNAQFLNQRGSSSDLQYSRSDDDRQFVQEMGAFLTEVAPGLNQRLGLPDQAASGEEFTSAWRLLEERLSELYSEVMEQLDDLHKEQGDLFAVTRPTLEHLDQYEALLRRSVSFGELLEPSSAANFIVRVALQAATEGRLMDLKQACERAQRLLPFAAGKWQLLADIAEIALRQAGDQPLKTGSPFLNSLAAGVADDWPGLVWELFEGVGTGPLPAWWEGVSQAARRVAFELEPEAPTPFLAITRLYYTLQAAVLQWEEKSLVPTRIGSPALTLDRPPDHLLKTFQEDVVYKWKQAEPAPPFSSIDYKDLQDLLAEVELLLPEARAGLEAAFSQAQAQAEIVLSAWERKDFNVARRGLRLLLLNDPDRRRLLQADRAVESAATWLARVRRGAGKDEPFYDYLTGIELAGRTLRNQVGAASWLDTILAACKRLRKGARSADLLMDHPQVLNEIPWLNEYRSREILSLPRTRPLALEREEPPQELPAALAGVVEGQFGPEQAFTLADALDTWAPEARGSSARVFLGVIRNRQGQPSSYAIKIMRPDRVEYALPLFRDEIQILSILRDVPGVSPLVELGFLHLEADQQLPGDARHASAAALHGQMVRYGVEEAQNYLASIDRRLAAGWLPYLALVKRDEKHNLMRYCDAGYTRGWFLPLRESLVLGLQICDILQFAHDRNIVYRDHKLLHYYWDAASHGVVMIDWNIAKRQAQGLSEAERQHDLVQFGARALHHILTGRPAPGALPLGPNRPEEIENAALSYAVNWTYDDERLPNRVKEILEQVLNHAYTQVKDLRQDLAQVYQQAPEPVQDRMKT
jgi:hypothetical protein